MLPSTTVTASLLRTDDPTDLLEKTLASLDLPADWVGIRVVKDVGTWRSLRDGHPDTNLRARDHGAMVEVMVDGQLGYAATHHLTPAGLRAAATQACQQAQAAAPWQLHQFAPTIRPPVKGIYHSPIQRSLPSRTAGDINDLLVKGCDRLKVSDQIVQTRASANTREVDTWLASTSGTQVHQRFDFLMLHFGVTAQDGAVVQTRSHNGPGAHCYQGGWELLDEAQLWPKLTQVGEQAVALLTAEDCPETTTTLVLAPDQMMLQIHESIGHPLELDRILGDERNYAGGSFVKPSDFGRLQYGSKALNITFDPMVDSEFASYSFDDTGAVAERQYLIKDGILQQGLGSHESQARLGVPGVACARATNWDRPPIDRMANINLEPGDRSFTELVGAISDGVYMEANRSWSIDDQRHKFQFGCEYARRIRNGQLAEVLRNPNYRATTPQFWHSLVQVGNRASWQAFGTPFCGKGEPNQIIRVGHGSPVCAFENIEVFGGAS
ncbi:MAG: TldD/PmbA family protein [Leptolyngbyaceae cyanobacterium]